MADTPRKRTAKADLPTKECPVCLRPFTWRKKWERVWSEVLLRPLPGQTE